MGHGASVLRVVVFNAQAHTDEQTRENGAKLTGDCFISFRTLCLSSLLICRRNICCIFLCTSGLHVDWVRQSRHLNSTLFQQQVALKVTAVQIQHLNLHSVNFDSNSHSVMEA